MTNANIELSFFSELDLNELHLFIGATVEHSYKRYICTGGHRLFPFLSRQKGYSPRKQGPPNYSTQGRREDSWDGNFNCGMSSDCL
ncbi:Uncharacterised protein [Sphingobacterium daejeonense]|nr:Uncharacterised protein [Sphingobacterium daejeonense]